MPRNLDRRVEVMVPVEDPDLCARLQEILDLNLADDTQAWRLLEDATWVRVQPAAGLNVPRALQDLALERARRRREPDALARP